MRRARHLRLCLIISCALYLSVVFVFHSRLQIDAARDMLIDSAIFTPKIKQVTIGLNTSNMIFNPMARVNKQILEVNPEKTFDVEQENKTSLGERSEIYSQFQNCQNIQQESKFQTLEEKNIFVHSVYLDQRYDITFLRLMSIVSKIRKKNVQLFCNFQNGDTIFPVEAKLYEMCENHNKKFGGFIFSCPVPHSVKQLCKINVTWSLSSHSDVPTPTNHGVILNIIPIFLENAVYDYGVCVPPLFGNINPDHFIEFMELTQILGAQHFILYDFNIKSNIMRKILDYYIEKGVVTLIPWKMPLDITENYIWYHGQLIAHNDCLYRSMSLFKHLSINDIDEYIVPHNNVSTWHQSFSNLFNDNICALSFQSAFYDPGSAHEHPSGLLTMGHTGRSVLTSKVRTKVMMKPSKIFEVGIHHISKPITENYAIHLVDPLIAYLHHYRKCVANYGMKCKFEVDQSMWQYLDELKAKFDFVQSEIKSL